MIDVRPTKPAEAAEEQVHTFPAIYEWLQSKGSFYLFIDESTAVVLSDGDKDEDPGTVQYDLVDCTVRDCWRRLSPGEALLLTNTN